MNHILKCWPAYWHALERGDKNFEVRRDDRGFQRGDTLTLRRTRDDDLVSVAIKSYGGRDPHSDKWRDGEFYDLTFEITYILTGGQFGIEPGHVVMGLRRVTT